ncbi:MAG TPA: hypothetical protein VGN76_01215 [Gemmatimonadales bacterium]|jgi:hypothetical protein|nr:hypothetical protein [Gemmatimonadales bacterium]
MTALLLAACGGQPAAPAQPAGSAAGVVQGFMQAVADSNLAKMATLWGTSSGPAAKTGQPSDYERRIVIMQAYLRNESFRITSDVPASADRRDLQVELKRQTCTWSVPFLVVKTGNGSWVINQVDLTAAGNPARPCLDGADSAAKG